MEVFSEIVTLGSEGDRVSLRDIFTLFQRVAGDHVDSLNLGRAYFDAIGAAWVLTSEHMVVTAMPAPGQTVKVSTWPGDTKFALFPRYFLLEDLEGNELIGAGSLWSIMDLKARKILYPEQSGVSVTGIVTGRETPLAKTVRSVKSEPVLDMTVTAADIDVNGHMNNAVYLDWLEQVLGGDFFAAGGAVKELTITYKKELLLGDTARIRIARDESALTMQGLHEDKTAFSVAVAL